MQYLRELQDLFAVHPLVDALKQTAELFPASVKFSSSLGQEDQLLTHVIASNHLPIDIFTIDTGRLFNETYELLDITRSKYNVSIDVYFPQTFAVQDMVKTHGVNLFYDSVEKRQLCCNTRKVEPLNRALQNTSVWITGLRAEQTDHRKNIEVVEWLPERSIYKINPLLHYSFEDILQYINEHGIPCNSLHKNGFISIGCAPCTRAINAGETARAGRWWWETSQKECGLHLVK